MTKPILHPTSCQLCTKDWHAEPATENDEWGLTCPGDDAEEGVKDFYLAQRAMAVDKKKIEDTNWDEFGDEAKDAYQARARSDVSHEALQADCDVRTDIARSENYWLQVKPDVDLSELAAHIEAENEAAPLDIQDNHLIVPGKVPVPKQRIAVAPMELEKLTKEQKDRDTDVLLYLSGDEQ